MTSVVGHLPKFNGSAAEWDVFAEQLSYYFVANGIDDADKKRAILLSACGAATYKLLKTLVAPAELTTKSFAELVQLAKEHYTPKPSIIMCRFKFNSAFREQGESISAFVTRLRDLATSCEYGESATELIRDRLVCGVRDDVLQRTLLAVPKLTYDKAYELALLHESAAQNSRLLSTTSPMQPLPVHHSSSSENKQPAKCYRCGGSHSARTCRFKDYECNFCSKKGHIQRVCQTRLRQLNSKSPPVAPKKGTQHRTHKVEEETEPPATTGVTGPPTTQETPPQQPLPVDYNVFVMGPDKTAEPYLTTVTINGATLKMEIDTGSAVTLVSQATFSKLWPDGNSPRLEGTAVRLKTYSGQELEVVGRAVVRVRCGGQVVEDLGLVVVGGGGPSLLGRDWLGRLRVDWRGVHELRSSPGTLESLLAKYANLFGNELGTIKGVTAKIHVGSGAKPCFYRPRSVPYSLRSRVDQALEKLVREGILEPVRFSEWAAPIVPVVKRDGSIRVCGDYKLTVNQAALVDTYPLPLVQDILASLANGQSFTKLDLAHAYQQLTLEEDSRKYTTINTHKGLFQYTRLPFGVAAAPAIFQRTMESLLGDLPHVCIYLDDILVTGESEAAHLQNLAAVLERLETAGIRLKREKCAFMIPEVEYLGHSISAEGVHPVKEKVRAVMQAPQPRNVSQLRSFLGMVNYYAKFLPNLATLLRPLYDLLQTAKTWEWGEAQEQAFRKAKELLSTAPLLTHYDPSRPLMLACDASPYGVGAVLSHRVDDTERLVAYASRTLTPAEWNYSQLDKEALSIVFGVKHFHQFLSGRSFTIHSDHKPLQYLLGETRGIPPMASARVQRWALMLSAYRYNISYKPGVSHANADGLSRLPVANTISEVPLPGDVLLVFRTLESTPVTASQIRQWTDTDPVLSRVRSNLLTGWVKSDDSELRPYQTRASELSVQDGCVLWGSRVIVPKKGREAVVTLLHEQHPGITRIKRLARGYVWWPGMDQELEVAVRECDQCQQHQKSPARAPMHPWEWPERPWARIHIDYAGPFRGKMILVMVDSHSKWMEALLVNSATSHATIEKLKSVFATHGLPEVLVSDNGTAFTSEEFSAFMRRNGIQHLTSAPYHPASNGLAERAVQTLKGALRKDVGEVSLDSQIQEFLFRYRITPHSTTGIPPAELLLGRRPRSRLDLLQPDIAGRVRQRQTEQKTRYDRHCRSRDFTVGQPIWVKSLPVGGSWLPGTIVGAQSRERFTVCLQDGRTIDRHIDHLQPRWATPQDEPAQGPVIPATDLLEDRNPPTLPDSSSANPVEQPPPPPRRSARDRRPPERFM